jgi:superfamily II DNA/RNA helicase
LSTPELREEVRRVKELLELAKRIMVDSKAQELRQFVRGVLDKAPQEKLLIFTEYTDTLDYLRDQVLRDVGPMVQLYGSMSPDERQVEEGTFQRPDVHLMLATDAAGEDEDSAVARPEWQTARHRLRQTPAEHHIEGTRRVPVQFYRALRRCS